MNFFSAASSSRLSHRWLMGRLARRSTLGSAPAGFLCTGVCDAACASELRDDRDREDDDSSDESDTSLYHRRALPTVWQLATRCIAIFGATCRPASNGSIFRYECRIAAMSTIEVKKIIIIHSTN